MKRHFGGLWATLPLLIVGAALSAGSSRLASTALTVASDRATTPIFGVLQATPGHAAAEYRIGLRLVVLELGWNRYETQAGKFDAAYVAQMRQRMQVYRNAGMRVMLDFGMQYPPQWVFRQVGARFVNQYGQAYIDTSPGGNGVNAVFNEAMRKLQASYVRQVFKDLGTDFYAVRLGWGQDGELGYPPARKYHGRRNCYWCFGPMAQGKEAGLPQSLKPCPVPGWLPGVSSPQHLAASQFINWYLDGLKNYQNWQIRVVRRYYDGRLAILYPSWGIRPGQLATAIARNLDGSTGSEVNGEIQRGFDYRRLIHSIRDSKTTVYCTWVDANPVGFCNDKSPDVTLWSPVHYLAFLARHHQPPLAVWGENTGHPDDLANMQLCFQRLRAYHMIGLLWAFEHNLFAIRKMATLGDYGQLITKLRGSGRRTQNIVPARTGRSSRGDNDVIPVE